MICVQAENTEFKIHSLIKEFIDTHIITQEYQDAIAFDKNGGCCQVILWPVGPKIKHFFKVILIEEQRMCVELILWLMSKSNGIQESMNNPSWSRMPLNFD